VGLEHLPGSLDTLLYREVCTLDKDRLRGRRNGFVLCVDPTRRVLLLTAPQASSRERTPRTERRPYLDKCLRSRVSVSSRLIGW
jgi:hypothetical protein